MRSSPCCSRPDSRPDSFLGAGGGSEIARMATERPRSAHTERRGRIAIRDSRLARGRVVPARAVEAATSARASSIFPS